MAYEPTHEDFNLWAAGHRPTNAPTHEFAQLEASGTTDLVSQPFAENVVSYGVKGVELFKDVKNHPDAVGAILARARSMAKFDPTTGLGDQLNSFNDFIQKVSTFPGFDLTYNEQSGKTQVFLTNNEIIEIAKGAYGGMEGVDLAKVVDSVNRMANSVVNGSSKTANKTYFVQMTITGSGDDLLFTLLYAGLKMEEDQKLDKKTYSSSQDFALNKSVFTVRRNSLINNADRLYKLCGDGSFDEWVSSASSPVGEKKSCFESRDATKEQ